MKKNKYIIKTILIVLMSAIFPKLINNGIITDIFFEEKYLNINETFNPKSKYDEFRNHFS